jgi:hypothetical protein
MEIGIRSMHTKSSQNNISLVHATNLITQQVPELRNYHVLENASTLWNSIIWPLLFPTVISHVDIHSCFLLHSCVLLAHKFYSLLPNNLRQYTAQFTIRWYSNHTNSHPYMSLTYVSHCAATYPVMTWMHTQALQIPARTSISKTSKFVVHLHFVNKKSQ